MPFMELRRCSVLGKDSSGEGPNPHAFARSNNVFEECSAHTLPCIVRINIEGHFCDPRIHATATLWCTRNPARDVRYADRGGHFRNEHEFSNFGTGEFAPRRRCVRERCIPGGDTGCVDVGNAAPVRSIEVANCRAHRRRLLRLRKESPATRPNSNPNTPVTNLTVTTLFYAQKPKITRL